MNADTHARRMLWFATLSHKEQIEAIQKLAADGMSDHDIAAATKLSAEMIRQIIGARVGCQECEE